MPRFFLFKFFPRFEIYFYKNFFRIFKIFLGIILSLFSLSFMILQFISIIQREYIKILIFKLTEYCNEFTCLFILFIIVFYVLSAVYFFMFKFNLFNFVGIKWGKRTNILSLYSSSSMFTYFIFPIMINFYTLFFTTEDSAFERAVGCKKYLVIAGVNIINYYPIICIVIIFLTVCDWPIQFLLNQIGITQFFNYKKVTYRQFRTYKKTYREIFEEIVDEINFSKYFKSKKNSICKSILSNPLMIN